MLATFQIGVKGQLTEQTARQQARRVARLIDRQVAPRVPIIIGVDGYDGDSRDIWEIPEVRNYVIAFAEAITQRGIDLKARLLPQYYVMIQACYAAREGLVFQAGGSEEDAIRLSILYAVQHYQQRTRDLH